MKTTCITLVALLLPVSVLSAAAWDESAKPSRAITYKTVGEIELKLHVFDPPAETKKPMPAVVFFFGGGWTSGKPAQFYHQANYLARHGFLAISADYRTMSNGKATPAECVKDCKSAIRYVREHAGELGVDPERIAAGGMSAGGHTAAATGTVKGFEHDDEELSISSRPNAMVLFNPVYDNSEGAYGYGRVSKYWKEFSPLHNIDKDTPPAIVFFGSQEKLVSMPVMKEFQAKMQALGIKSELKIYEGQGHGFANYGRGGNKYFIETMDETHKFFEGLEWISGKTDAEEYVASFVPNTETKPRPAAKAFPKEGEIPEGHAFPGEKTEFKGYDRYKVRAGRGNMTVICPKEAAPGKPWMWRSGMFWQAIPRFHEADLKLVKQGYHVVLAAGHVYGHPNGNALIDAAYDLLTTKYGFAKKCSMASMSRETCALFRWASTHPERVESIYVDNGVLSLRSWPGGAQVPGSTSRFKGHLPSWEGLKKAYGFTSDAQALAAQISPVDLLDPLARAGVPILSVCGSKDDCCIYDEHDAILEQRYKALGGSIKVIVEDKGHSHGMNDPTPVLEFIRKHTSASKKQTSAAFNGQTWIVDSQNDWQAATADQSNLEFEDGLATPTAREATFRSVLITSEKKRSAKSLTIDQSPVWHNWNPIPNLGPANLGDAPVMLTVGPGNYWMFGRYGGSQKKKGFQSKAAELEGFDAPLKTTPFPNQYDAPGGLKKGLGGYHAWQSRDMINWVHHGPVTEAFSSWVTTAEYADGKLYLYYDYPNDQDPHLYIDDDLTDGLPGENKGMAFKDPSHGSDCAFIRDLKGNFHVIYEDWSPIDASTHSWDSPLAGHAVSKTGMSDFRILPPAVDVRTKPTGRFGEYPHPHWHATDPKNYPGKPAPVDVPMHRIKKGQVRAFAKYEIHEPEQDAFGDWASICIGGQYYLFADYHPAKSGIRVGWFTSSSLDKPFTFCGEIGKGHPDPDIMFAEGKFYLATQMSTDYVSPGPWVETVEARVGVDTDKDEKIDQWTDWTELKESYDYIKGFSKQIAKTPAELNLSKLPAGYGLQFELKITDSTENASIPILDKVVLSFEE